MGVGQYKQNIETKTGLKPATRDVLMAALHSVGALPWANVNNPEFDKWKVGSPKVWSGKTGKEDGLNCWTAVIFWAFQGGGLSRDKLLQYQGAIKAAGFGNQAAIDKASADFLRYGKTATIGQTAEAGRTVFFSVPDRPLSHVALALGDDKVISCWQVRAHPLALKNEDLPKGLTHIIDIDSLKQICGGDNCTVKQGLFPFWEDGE